MGQWSKTTPDQTREDDSPQDGKIRADCNFRSHVIRNFPRRSESNFEPQHDEACTQMHVCVSGALQCEDEIEVDSSKALPKSIFLDQETFRTVHRVRSVSHDEARRSESGFSVHVARLQDNVSRGNSIILRALPLFKEAVAHLGRESKVRP